MWPPAAMAATIRDTVSLPAAVEDLEAPAEGPVVFSKIYSLEEVVEAGREGTAATPAAQEVERWFSKIRITPPISIVAAFAQTMTCLRPTARDGSCPGGGGSGGGWADLLYGR